MFKLLVFKTNYFFQQEYPLLTELKKEHPVDHKVMFYFINLMQDNSLVKTYNSEMEQNFDPFDTKECDPDLSLTVDSHHLSLEGQEVKLYGDRKLLVTSEMLKSAPIVQMYYLRTLMYQRIEQADLNLLSDIYHAQILKDSSLIKNFLLGEIMFQFADLAFEYLSSTEDVCIKKLSCPMQAIKTALHKGWLMTTTNPSAPKPEDFLDIVSMQLLDYNPEDIDVLVIGCNAMTSEQASVFYHNMCDKEHGNIKGLSLTMSGRTPGVMFFDMYNEKHWQCIEKWSCNKKFHILNHSYLPLGCSNKDVKEVMERIAFSTIDDNGHMTTVSELLKVVEENTQDITLYSDLPPILGYSLVESFRDSVLHHHSPTSHSKNETAIIGDMHNDEAHLE